MPQFPINSKTLRTAEVIDRILDLTQGDDGFQEVFCVGLVMTKLMLRYSTISPEEIQQEAHVLLDDLFRFWEEQEAMKANIASQLPN